MDVTFNNVLEGTRQYFMGLPKQAQGEGIGQSVWPAGAPPPEEGAPAQSGAPAPSSRPPSAAAAPPAAQPDAPPPRPPSEPLEPEPHIIHKATVMREAAEKRRELPDPDDEEEPADALSPPSHIIRKPTVPGPPPAPAPPPQPPAEPLVHYRPLPHHAQTPPARPPDHFAPGRPPDLYSSSRPPEPYPRYYESNLPDGGRGSRGAPAASPQPSAGARQSPQQTYARLSGAMPPHANAPRLRDAAAHSPPVQRYASPVAQPPLHNDRVPPIHHPQSTPTAQRLAPVDGRSAHMYPPLPQRRDSSPYGRATSHYERQPAVPPRKYDPQQAYPGYRPTATAAQPVQSHRVEHQHVQYRHAATDSVNMHYARRPPERAPASSQHHPHKPQHRPQDSSRVSRVDYSSISRTADGRSGYHYSNPTPSTSSVRYAPTAPIPIPQNPTSQSRSLYRSTPPSKTGYDYSTPTHIQTSPVRPIPPGKPGYSSQQARMTVSVTSLVNQMNQTKQKRESPLDLSVKTVKNSADSSTTQDEVIDSASMENKTFSLQSRPLSNSRHVPQTAAAYVASHKVDFSPDFTQYRERSGSLSASYSGTASPGQPSVLYNGSYETPRPVIEPYPAESRHQVHSDRNKYSVPVARTDYIPRIDLTKTVTEDRHREGIISDDRHFIIDDYKKRPAEKIKTNIPDKIVRYETWSADSRIDRMNRSAREQHELMSRPVYSYSSHKRFEAFQNEQDRSMPSSAYRENANINLRYSYSTEPSAREPSEYHTHYHDRNPSTNNNRHVIQRIPSHRDMQPRPHVDPHSGVPADKRVLSILRNSLETKQTGYVEPARPARELPELIVIDDVDDPLTDITDLTKENDIEVLTKNDAKPAQRQITSTLAHHIQMPKAIDSISRDLDYHRTDSAEPKSKSPENDVASRIRTKAELKVLPPSQDNSVRTESKHITTETDKPKLLPKSQKQHLFNQIREDNLRLESVIKIDKPSEIIIPEVKTEPLNVEEIEKDAELPIKTENILEELEPQIINTLDNSTEEDLCWVNTCDNLLEQLKSGGHKNKLRRKRIDIQDYDTGIRREKSPRIESVESTPEKVSVEVSSDVVIKQEPVDEDEIKVQSELELLTVQNSFAEEKVQSKSEKTKIDKNNDKESEKVTKNKVQSKNKSKIAKKDSSSSTSPTKKELKEKEPIKAVMREESESTDDDEPLIKSKLLKEKEQNERFKHQLLKDLSEKSAYVKLECFDMDMNKNNRKSMDSTGKDKEEKQSKGKLTRHASKPKGKFTENNKDLSVENNKNDKPKDDSTSDSDYDDDLSVASRIRGRRSIKNEENKVVAINKTPVKISPSKKSDSSNNSANSTPIRKPGFGDGSDFHPGWEEELYRYKRSLRMPSTLIAIPRGRSGGPFVKGANSLFIRGSTSLPDLDPAPLSPAPSSAPSAVTDDLYARRPDKLALDSDLESNSSSSAANRLHYDSEASTSTVFSSKVTKKSTSIVDVLMQKCGKRDDGRKKKDKDDKIPKIIPKSSNTTELLPTPSLGLVKNGNKGNLSAKKEKLMEDSHYLGFRKETVTAFRKAFITNTDGLIGATEEFAPMVLKSRTRTESRILKQKATIKEVFGDERPASAPPSSCIEDEEHSEDIKEELESKSKLKSKKLVKEKLQRRSSSIRDGLRSTKSLKRNDAKGRLLRLKKRNNLMKSIAKKRIKEILPSKNKTDKSPTPDDKDKPKEEGSSLGMTEGNTKRRLKRLFGRRKFSSGFDYIRKKKKIIRREENSNKVRRTTVKPSPESVHDIQKEIKSWFINKSIGETHLHRAARLGYTDCVAYCLEKMEADPSAKDNAGFTPLHVASAKGHVRIARLLLEYGANVSAAARGGIRPLHEACENCNVEVIRLLLAYGADPLLGTYAGQTPEELAEGPAAALLRLHIADVQGLAVEPWRFPPPAEIIDREEIGFDPLCSPPPSSPPPPDSTLEIQCTEAPLPPFYSLRAAPGQPADGLWCLLQDITNLLQIKSKESLLKQIHCGSGSPKELLREIRTQEFLERAQCHQLLCAGEKVNVRASKVALVRVTDKLRQLLKVETVLVS